MGRAREGIEQADYYPEPAWITARGGMRFWYRFLLGRPMDGRRWSDSTFWRPATRGEDQWWLRLAGWQRAAVRASTAYALLLLAPCATLLTIFRGTGSAMLLLVAHAAGVLMAWSPIGVYRAVQEYGIRLPWPTKVTVAYEDRPAEHRWTLGRLDIVRGRRKWLNEKVRPVARAVAARTNRRYHPREAAQWVHVPYDYREPDGGRVEILLPQSFALNEAARRALANAAAERLGMRDPEFTYQMEGNSPRLLLSAPVEPPPFVSFADMASQLKACEAFCFALGMAGKEILSISLKEDSPHLALSAGSGAGKSELIKLLVAQALHWGWSVIILDWKEESQEWAENLPGVKYVRSIEALHDTCVEIGEEVEWRKAHRGQERPNVLVVSEEWGITAPLLADFWTALRSTAEPEERRTMPLKSPAAVALMKLNFTGRSLGMCQLLVAQRFSARVTNGNADLRESFTTIFMSRWKAQTFKMLAPDVRPIPRKLTKPGQWLAVTGDEVVRFQAGLWTDEEAREWALSGEPSALSPWASRLSSLPTEVQPGALKVPAIVVGELAQTPHNDPSQGTTGVLPSEILGSGPAETLEPVEFVKHAQKGALLSELAETLEPVGVSLAMLRKAARDDKLGDRAFPSPVGGHPFKGYRYDREAVTDWARKKQAAKRTRNDGRERKS